MKSIVLFCGENKLQMDYSPRFGEGTIYLPESIRLNFVVNEFLQLPINYTLKQYDILIKEGACTESDLITNLKKAIS